MAKTIPFTAADIIKVIDGRYHSPVQDVVGDNYTLASPLATAGGVEENFVCNGNTRNFSVFPAHVTNIWNTTTNIATFGEFLNTPEMVANVQFTFDPSVAAAGIITVRAYVNETVPLLIKEVNLPYKATATDGTALITFYAGDATGFDVKNKGVFFTIESGAAGDLYDFSIELYRT